MPHGYDQGFDVITGAQQASHDLAPVRQQGKGASLRSGFPCRADQYRLAAADGRDIEHDAQMTRQSKPPRMRDTMPVNGDQIGRRFQFPQGLYDRWKLSERKQAGDICAAQRFPGRSKFNHWKRSLGIQDHSGGKLQIAPFVVGHIDTRNISHPIQMVLFNHFSGEAVL